MATSTEKDQQWKDAQTPQSFAQPRSEPKAPISPTNIFPQGHPSAGKNIYAGAGKELGSSGTFATVPPEMSNRGNSIAAAATRPAAAPAPAPATTPSIAAAATPPVANPLLSDPQVQSDRAKAGAAWDTLKDVNDTAGRAIADIAMLPARAAAGAYDTALARPLRAAGVDAPYLSGHLVPKGVDPSSMTPYTDKKRMTEAAGAGAASSIAQAASTKPWEMNALAGKLGGMDNEMRYQSQLNGMPAAGGAAAGPVSIAAQAAQPTTNNVTRVGNSYSGTNVAGDITVNGQEAGGGFSVIPKAGMVGGGGAQSQGAVNMALAAAASRGDWNAVRSHYANRGQSFGGQTPEQIKASIPQGPQTSVMRVGAFGFDPQAREARIQQQSIADAATNPNLTRSQRAAAIDLQRQQMQSADNAARIGADERRNESANQTSIANAAMRERGDDRRAADSNAIQQRQVAVTEQNAQAAQKEALRKQTALQEYGDADTDEKRAAIKRRYPDVFPQEKERPASEQFVKIRTQQTTNSKGETSGGGDVLYDPRTGQLINPSAGIAPQVQGAEQQYVKGEIYDDEKTGISKRYLGVINGEPQWGEV